MSITATTAEIRTLSENEVDNVNGGFIVIGLALLFAAGEIAGGMIFDAYHGGDPYCAPAEGVGLGA